MRKFFEVKDEFKKIKNEPTILPTRMTTKSCAYDFYAKQDYICEPGKVIKIWTDVKCAMEDDDVLELNIRSSMGGTWRLANIIGYIDADYFENPNNDGNIGIFLKNTSKEVQNITKGDRIGQGKFSKYLITDDDKPVSEKRKGGFGSSGK